MNSRFNLMSVAGDVPKGAGAVPDWPPDLSRNLLLGMRQQNEFIDALCAKYEITSENDIFSVMASDFLRTAWSCSVRIVA